MKTPQHDLPKFSGEPDPLAMTSGSGGGGGYSAFYDSSYQRNPQPSDCDAVVIFGPPGAGKRTVLEVAKSRGYQTCNITDLGRSYTARKAGA